MFALIPERAVKLPDPVSDQQLTALLPPTPHVSAPVARVAAREAAQADFDISPRPNGSVHLRPGEAERIAQRREEAAFEQVAQVRALEL